MGESELRAACRRYMDGEITKEELAAIARMRVKRYSAEVSEPNLIECEQERDWFKGEMEQFMRAASANHARALLLEGLLREVEWGGTLIDRHLDGKRLLLEACCPSCGQPRSGGHRPDCRIRAALESPAAARATDGAG